MRYAQRGFTLIESTIAAAIVAIAVGSLLYAMGSFGRFSSQQAGPIHASATFLAEQTVRVAEDTWKYGAPGSAPVGTVNATVPLRIPNAAPTTAPVTITTTVSNSSSASSLISVTVSYRPDPDHLKDPGSVTLSGQMSVKAPLPASTVAPAALIAQPSNAP